MVMTTDDEHKLDNYLPNKGKVKEERKGSVWWVWIISNSWFPYCRWKNACTCEVVRGLDWKEKEKFNMSCFTMSRLSTQLKYYSLKITIFSPVFDAYFTLSYQRVKQKAFKLKINTNKNIRTNKHFLKEKSFVKNICSTWISFCSVNLSAWKQS